MSSSLAVRIRRAEFSDLEAILALQALSLRQLSLEHYQPTQVEALVNDQAQYRYQDFVQVVAEYEGHIVGVGALSIVPYPQIPGVYVHPDLIHRGIGRQLVQELERVAIAQPRPLRTLKVLSSLMAAPFYQRQGYHLQRDGGFWTRDWVWIECKVLTKRLMPPSRWERWQPWLALLLLWLVAIVLKLLG